MTKKAKSKCGLCSRPVKQKSGPGRPRRFCNATCCARYHYLQAKWSRA